MSASTLNAGIGCANPLRVSGPRASREASWSTAAARLCEMRIWSDRASPQSRAARLVTVPMAAESQRPSKPMAPSVA